MRLSTVVRSIGLTVSNAVRTGIDPAAIPDPPLRLVDRVGRGDYRALGEHLRALVVDVGGLRPSDRVLDIGCGVGRLAAPLTRYLVDGSYEGFDIDADLVAWCTANISARHPRFRFRHVDVQSGVYNPAGAVEGKGFTFPYNDAAFTFVVATSLFTHLLAGDAANYLRQAARVLAPGGTLLATFFLLDDVSRSAAAEGRAQVDFAPVGASVHHVQKTDKPEAAVAYSTGWVRERLAETGFARDLRIAGGGWCSRPGAVTYQDVVIARK